MTVYGHLVRVEDKDDAARFGEEGRIPQRVRLVNVNYCHR